MAGRQQHTIPRFLLKGFVSKVVGDQSYTWLYRRGTVPVQTNILRVSTSRDFYGKPGPETVDELITEAEYEKYAPLTDVLRSQKPGIAVPTATAVAEFVMHIGMRTRFLRKAMGDSVKAGIDILSARFTERESFAEMLQSPLGRKIVIETLTNNGVQEPRATEVAPLVQHAFAESVRKGESSPVAEMKLFMETLRSAVPQAIMDGQTKAITQHLLAPESATNYASYNWHVIASEMPLLLADAVCIFETDTERRFRAFNDSGVPPLRVYLPIASKRVLIGTPYKARPKLDARAFRKAVAKCSYEFFVSATELPADSAMPKSIGEWSELLTKEELRAAMTPALE